MTAAPAVETKDLTKVFERAGGRMWQRLRGRADKRGTDSAPSMGSGTSS